MSADTQNSEPIDAGSSKNARRRRQCDLQSQR